MLVLEIVLSFSPWLQFFNILIAFKIRYVLMNNILGSKLKLEFKYEHEWQTWNKLNMTIYLVCSGLSGLSNN